MKTSNHGWRAAVKAAVIPVAVLATVIGITDWVGALADPQAGVAFIVVVAMACWAIFRDRPARHPAPARRKSRGRDPEIAALADSNEPVRIAA